MTSDPSAGGPLPLVRRLRSAPSPERVFARVQERPWSLWLDSSRPDLEVGRYSFVAVDPFALLVSRAGGTTWIDAGGPRPEPGGALAALDRALSALDAAAPSAGPPGESSPAARDLPPFAGGAGGFLSYELGAEIERLPDPRSRDLGVPDLELAFYDVVVGWDHREGTCWIASTGLPEAGPRRLERARRRLDEAAAWVEGRADAPAPLLPASRAAAASDPGRRPGAPPVSREVPGAPGLVSTFDRAGYEAAVREGVERIRAGDIFQVNLSQRFSSAAPADPFAFYLELRRRTPAPFGAWFRGSGGTLASSSPERFLRVDRRGLVEARPIKGTRPRGEDPNEDARLAADLRSSVKDRAENLMIADLLRNDLSRVCLPGTVRARELFRLETYATVHHLVSVIEGRMRPGSGPVDLLRAAFPCGSVTGAPKVRAMEIIATLEPVARGPCYGSIGWIGLDGSLDLSVAIRTAVVAGGKVAFHAGGAVVADSSPGSEYGETLDKARGVAAALGFEV